MKAKHLLMAMALPVAFAACSQEEIVSNSNEGNDIPKLAKDFTLVAEKANDVESRGAYVEDAEGNYEFKWVLGSENLGVCWTGKVGEVDYTDQANKNLYTNYLFKDIAGANELNSNGSLKSETPTSGNEGSQFTYANFNTTASSLFAGQYVVYSPYSANFKGVGKIQAVTPYEVNVTSTSVATQLASVTPYMFLMSPRTDLVGGQQTAGFRLSPKSTILELKMQLVKNEATTVKVDKVILFDETKLASVIEYDADGTKGNVTYGHMSISANYSAPVQLAADNDALDQLKSFMIPVLTENLKATTRIYVHDAQSKKWAMVPFSAEYALQAGIKPLTLPSFKATDFNMTLITSATEFAAAVKNATVNDVIDILTDITVKASDMTSGYSTKQFTITSGTGATLKLDVNEAPFTFGNNTLINFDCDVEVIDSDLTNGTNAFTLKCPSSIYGNFTNKVAEATFNAIVNVEEDGKLTNNGGLAIPTGKDLAVFGAVENNGDIAIASGADFLINGRNAAVVNNGTISNDGNMTVIKYNTNSVLNNGVAVVGVAGQFTGDFDAASTGSFWKEVNTKAMFEEALAGNYTKVVLLAATYDYSAIITDAVINAGDKDIELVSGAILSLPINVAVAPNSNDFTLVTTGEITLNETATWGNVKASATDASKANITIQAGKLNVKAPLTIEGTGTLTVNGDINANAAVNFNKYSTASFVNFNNLVGGSFNSAQGANVTYTGRINF